MRANRRLKQKMQYSMYIGSQPIYETDEFGNIIYVEVDGVQVPVETGDTLSEFSEPQELNASLQSKLNEMNATEYGVDQKSIYAQLCVSKQEFPLKLNYGTYIWKDSQIVWKDATLKIPDINSADYMVKGIIDEYQHFTFYLLERMNYVE